MPQIAREGDQSDHAGAPIAAPAISDTVFVNGIPAAINAGNGSGASNSCGLFQENDPSKASDDVHPLGESPNGIHPGIPGPTGGSPTVFIGGIPVHRFRDSRGCGAETTTASPNVWADEVEQLSIPGATVQSPIYGPLAPISLDFLFEDGTIANPKSSLVRRSIFVFTEEGGNIQNNKFYRVRPNSTGKWWGDLGREDFKLIGSTLNYKLSFEEQVTGFEESDVDQTTKDSIPDHASNQFENFIARGEFENFSAEGIPTPDFPSYGQNDFQSSFTIPSPETSLLETWNDFAFGKCVTGVGGLRWAWEELYVDKKYHFSVRNESGYIEGFLSLIIMPYVPNSNSWK